MTVNDSKIPRRFSWTRKAFVLREYYLSFFLCIIINHYILQ